MNLTYHDNQMTTLKQEDHHAHKEGKNANRKGNHMPLRFMDIFPFHDSTVAKQHAGRDSEQGVGFMLIYNIIRCYYHHSQKDHPSHIQPKAAGVE